MLRVKCTKFNFGWGSAPDPLAEFHGATSKGREGKGLGMEGEKGRRGEERRKKGRRGGEGIR